MNLILSNIEWKRRVVESIQLLASDYETQISSLPDYVFIPDEVVLALDDTIVMIGDRLEEIFSNVIIEKLNEILNYITYMSDIQDVWSLEKMKIGDEWEQLRVMARDLLLKMNIKQSRPDIYWFKFIKSSK